jgi:hypothetical protein
LDRAERLIPVIGHRLQHDLKIAAAVAFDERHGGILGLCIAEQEYEFGFLARAQRELRLQRAAGIQAAAHAVRQSAGALHGGRLGQRAMSADEFGTIAGAGGLPAAEIQKGHARLEFGAPGIAGDERGCARLDFRDDEGRRPATLISQHPVQVVCDREHASFLRAIDEFQTRDFQRVFERHELQEVQRDAMRGIDEAGIAEAMVHGVRIRRLPDGQRRGAPHGAAAIVPEVNHLRRRVADRIVGPGCQLILARVQRPRAAGAVRGDLKAEVGIRDDIDPGRRRAMAFVDQGHVFAAGSGEAAQAVEILEVGSRPRRAGGWRRRGILPLARGGGSGSCRRASC